MVHSNDLSHDLITYVMRNIYENYEDKGDFE